MIRKTPLSAVVAATAATLEEEGIVNVLVTGEPSAGGASFEQPFGEDDPVVQTALSGGLEKLRIPFILWDCAEQEVPEEIVVQLRGRIFSPMMEIVWQSEKHLVATASFKGDELGKTIPEDVRFTALAIVQAELIDMTE